MSEAVERDRTRKGRRMKTFIIHADQTVVVSSPTFAWATEALRSKPTFSIEASSLDDALTKIEAKVRDRYTGPNQHVESVSISAQLVREIEA